MVLDFQPKNDQSRNPDRQEGSETNAQMESRQLLEKRHPIVANDISGKTNTGSTTETTAFTIDDHSETQVAFADKDLKRPGKEGDAAPEDAKLNKSEAQQKLEQKLLTDLDAYLKEHKIPKHEEGTLKEIVKLLAKDPESTDGHAEEEPYLPKGAKTLKTQKGAEALRDFLAGYGVTTHAITNNGWLAGRVTDTITTLDGSKGLSNVIEYEVKDGKRVPTIAATHLVSLEPADLGKLSGPSKSMGVNTVKVTDRNKNPDQKDVLAFRRAIQARLAGEWEEPKT